MADKFDPAAQAEHARQVTELATKARAALENHIVERNARLGLERDQAARAQYGAEQQRSAAELQAKRELGVAEKADKAAAEFERKAQRETRGEGYAEDLREQAGQQRALAEAARRRAHAADQESERLEMEANLQKRSVEALEAELKSPGKLAEYENEVDQLEWHAMNSRGIAEAAQWAKDLQKRIDEASARGEKALVEKLTSDLEIARLSVGVGDVLATSPVNTALLSEIGMTVPPGALDVPGFPATGAAQPTSMEESAPGQDEFASVDDASAVATDDVLGDATFDDDVTSLAAAADETTEDVAPAAADSGDVAATETFAPTDELVPAPTMDEPSFTDASFDQPEPAFDSFTEPVPQHEFADGGGGDFTDMG
jgi:hypothetical protein